MKIVLFIVGLLLPFVSSTQTIKGRVNNIKNEPLIGASVYWLNTSIGTSTDLNGKFELKATANHPFLVASYLGYKADTIEVKGQSSVKFKLKETQNLDEVVITSQQSGVIISSLTPMKTEQITQTELGKAACCDLAGCFDTQTTVQPQTTNVVTNSKELRMLGLSGVYTQVLIDGFPMIQGLTSTYGISSIPGTLVDNIYISKGANSVLQGFESISGQINVETKDPDNTDKFLLNVYVNSFLEKHLNANFATKIGEWSNLTTIHTVQPANKVDRDQDNFLDLPQLRRYMVSNKLKYGKEVDWGWSSEIGMRYVDEQRIGGQRNFNTATDKGSNEVYGQFVSFQQPEIWTKTGYRLNDKHNFALFASALHQSQDSYFGTVKYAAEQTNFYGNAQYELSYGTHALKTGFSFRYLNLEENVRFTNNSLNRTYAGNYLKNENIAGLFAENSFNFYDGKLSWILGLRADHHNEFGTIVTPRTLVKYNLSPNTVMRASIGTGWRTVKLFSENIGLLVSSRDILIKEELKPEKAVNTGINLTRKFSTENITGFFNADFYRTDFQNQIFPDYDTDPTLAIIENFNGKSVSNTFQAEIYLNFWEKFEFKTAYNFLDVYKVIEGKKELLPFNSRHQVVTTLGYQPLSKKYHLDANIHWYGKQRLPNTKANPREFQRPDQSKRYATVNAQFTYSLKNVEWYVGCENILDFRQKQPINSWQNPFGQYFDSSSAWGPTRGREIYVGIRFMIPNEE